jgi:hypothetical protein
MCPAVLDGVDFSADVSACATSVVNSGVAALWMATNLLAMRRWPKTRSVVLKLLAGEAFQTPLSLGTDAGKISLIICCTGSSYEPQV